MNKVENDHIFDVNQKAIEKEINVGMEILTSVYKLNAVATEEFAHLTIQNIAYHIKQYAIVGVGNLLVMDSKDSPVLQMVSFVITPYYKNLPLFSTDYLYIQQKRSFLIEYYDLVKEKDRLYTSYIDRFRAIKDQHRSLPDLELKKCWYDPLRSVCTAKNTSVAQDEEILALFTENLKLFIEMEQASGPLSPNDQEAKWRITQEYIDGLVDTGGVSTDVFKAVLGPEKTKDFFHKVFFGTARFK
ncbi:MAG TPA: bilin reductase [Bacillota bacterium]